MYTLEKEGQECYLDEPSEKAKNEDYIDFNLILIDNGDDKICLTGMTLFSYSYSPLRQEHQAQPSLPALQHPSNPL